MIISNAKDGTSFLAGTRLNLTQEATMLFGTMLEKTPEVFLASLIAYTEEITNLNCDDNDIFFKGLCSLAREAKKDFKESK